MLMPHADAPVIGADHDVGLRLRLLDVGNHARQMRRPRLCFADEW